MLALIGLLLLPLSCSKKSDELSDAEVNQIFNVLCLAIDDALSQASASVMTTNGHTANIRHAAVVITRQVNWVGSGKFAGFTVTGHITADTESGVYDGSYTYYISQYDASDILKQTVIINYANGQSTFNGQASEQLQFHHAENHDEFVIVIGTTRYDGSEYYTLDAVGGVVTLHGTIILNGKEYTLSN
jgi:hypothetical protein